MAKQYEVKSHLQLTTDLTDWEIRISYVKNDPWYPI